MRALSRGASLAAVLLATALVLPRVADAPVAKYFGGPPVASTISKCR